MEREYIQAVEGLPGEAGSPWLAGAAERHPALTEDIEVDIAVVGAGVVGALCALFASSAGARVAVVERRRLAGGVSGHSTAKVTAQHALAWGPLVSMHGAGALREYAARNAAAPREIEQLAARFGIDCDFAQMPSIVYAPRGEDTGPLEREAAAYAELGLVGSLEPAPDLPFDAAALTLVMPDQAVFDPAAFILGCMSTLPADAVVLEETPVRRVEQEDGRVELHCDSGVVRADAVVMASHFPVADTAGYFTRLHPYRSYAVSLSTDKAIPEASWIAADQASGVTLRPLRAGGDRWIASGVEHKAGQGGDERSCYEHLARMTSDLLGEVEFERHWSTQDSSTADGLPFVGKAPRSERLYMAAGFGGWGMTKSLVSARLLATLLGGGEDPLAELLDPGRADAFKGLSGFMRENADAGAHFMKGLTPKNRRAGAHCTHMGCVVELNEAELTWDCPCHGSRFAADASVVHGPARKDLPAGGSA